MLPAGLKVGNLLKEALAMEWDDAPLDFAIPSPAAPPVDVQGGNGSLKRRQEGPEPSKAHQRRRVRRAYAVEQQGHKPQVEMAEKYVVPAQPIRTPLELDQLQVAAGAYVGINSAPVDAQKPHELEELLQEGFTLVSWDGR